MAIKGPGWGARYAGSQDSLGSAQSAQQRRGKRYIDRFRISPSFKGAIFAWCSKITFRYASS